MQVLTVAHDAIRSPSKPIVAQDWRGLQTEATESHGIEHELTNSSCLNHENDSMHTSFNQVQALHASLCRSCEPGTMYIQFLKSLSTSMKRTVSTTEECCAVVKSNMYNQKSISIILKSSRGF